jgi:hypothetical protein
MCLNSRTESFGVERRYARGCHSSP